jgi:hypothetical protein
MLCVTHNHARGDLRLVLYMDEHHRFVGHAIVALG